MVEARSVNAKNTQKPMILPKRFDIFPPDCLDAQNISHPSSKVYGTFFTVQYNTVSLLHFTDGVPILCVIQYVEHNVITAIRTRVQ